MTNNSPQSPNLAAHASLPLLHNRFVYYAADLSKLKGKAHEFSTVGMLEIDRFSCSPFAATGEFQKYCALQYAAIMEIPIVFQDRRTTQTESPFSCDQCTRKNHPPDLVVAFAGLLTMHF